MSSGRQGRASLYCTRVVLLLALGLLVVRTVSWSHALAHSRSHVSSGHERRPCFDSNILPNIVPRLSDLHIPPSVFSSQMVHVQAKALFTRFELPHSNRPPPLT